MKIKILILFLFFVKIGITFSQKTVNLNNLESFKNPSKNWEIVGNIQGAYDSKNLTASPGSGILHCKPYIEGVKSSDLIFDFEHGDINISFDFMMPKGSNSGVYLQGQYEIQLLDSWGVKTPKAGDCGGIYERWNEARGKGNEGFEGHPPRQNLSFAPGLWQHMEIKFLSPKFDVNGKKIANAKFVKVVHNGFLIHENVELLGPTRGELSKTETAKGPLRIQGDHGEIALKNFKYELLNKEQALLQDVSYKYYEGKLENIPEKLPSKITSQGKLEKINFRVAEKNSDILIDFNGKISIPETDKYTFFLPTSGHAVLKIDEEKIIDTKGHKWRGEENKYELNLDKGVHKLELLYAKTFGWGGRALGLFIQREGTPKQPLHEYISLPDPDPVGLIEVKADPSKPILQRSFVYFDGKKRTHAINIGGINGLNYSYDLNRASLLHAWRGKFLNATEMWFERGEPQITEPLSASVDFDGKNTVITKIGDSIPDSLSVETEWIYKGYNFDYKKNPIFKYNYKNETVLDKISPLSDRSGLLRELNFSNYFNSETYVRAGSGNEIKSIENGTYLVDNHYIKIPMHLVPIITEQEANGKRNLLIPVISRNISYTIIW